MGQTGRAVTPLPFPTRLYRHCPPPTTTQHPHTQQEAKGERRATHRKEGRAGLAVGASVRRTAGLQLEGDRGSCCSAAKLPEVAGQWQATEDLCRCGAVALPKCLLGGRTWNEIDFGNCLPVLAPPAHASTLPWASSSSPSVRVLCLACSPAQLPPPLTLPPLSCPPTPCHPSHPSSLVSLQCSQSLRQPP